jgi:Flp pilus assembly protein TadB
MGFSQSQQDWETKRQLEEQRILTQDLKTQLDRQRTETDTLKTELERQRSETDKLVAQMQQQLETQQRLIDTINVQQQIGTADRDRVTDQLRAIEPRANGADQPIRLQSTLLWAVGVTLIVIALGGGVVLIVLIVLLAQSQRRYPRTVNVIHPMAAPPYPLAAQALLPSQTRPTKRTTQVDYLDD